MMIMNIVRRQVATVAPEDTISVAAQRLDDLDTDVVFVAVEGRPLGLLTGRDIALAVAARGIDRRAPVSEIMTPHTLAVEEEDYIFTAEQYMTERRVRHLPVVDSLGRMTGMVTYEDLLLHVASERLDGGRSSHDRSSCD